MESLSSRSVRWIVFAALALGLTAVGAVSFWLLHQRAANQYWQDQKLQVLQAAKMAAGHLDPDQLQDLAHPDQEPSKPFANQTQRLTQALQSATHLEHLSVLKSVGPQFVFLVDAARQGQAKSKARLFDPLEEPPPLLVETYRNAAPVVESEFRQDRWGTWLSAYAPVIDHQSGQSVAVLAADRDADKVNQGLDKIRAEHLFAFAILAIVSILAAAVVSAIVPVSSAAVPRLFTPQRRLLTEGVLLLALVGLGADAISSFQKIRSALEDQYLATQRVAALQLTEITLQAAQNRPDSPSIDYQPARDQLVQAALPSLAAKLEAAVKPDHLAPNEPKQPDPEQQKTLAREITQAQTEAVRDALQAVSKAENAEEALLRALVSGLVLAVVTLGIVRFAHDQAQSIADHQYRTSEAETQYANLLQHLPVGLFQIEAQAVTFANAEWDAQFHANHHNSRQQALANAIHPEDREPTLAILAQASQDARPFQVQFRTALPGRPVTHLEARGVPLYDNDGVCRKLLAFTLDTTATVEARKAQQQAFHEVEEKNVLLANALSELEYNLENVVRALVKAVEAKDPYTAGHSERVMRYSLWLGQAIGLGPYELRILELGTLVHDVGKIGIPDAILTKPDRLTDEEFAIIKKHPEYGVNIIGNISLFQECVPIVRWHHERLDGRGYPDGLRGEEIPLLVRISAIADIFDAMTSTRAYRKGMELDNVLEIMDEIAQRGEIDTHLFAIFCQVIRSKGIIAQSVVQEPWKAA